MIFLSTIFPFINLGLLSLIIAIFLYLIFGAIISVPYEVNSFFTSSEFRLIFYGAYYYFIFGFALAIAYSSLSLMYVRKRRLNKLLKYKETKKIIIRIQLPSDSDYKINLMQSFFSTLRNNLDIPGGLVKKWLLKTDIPTFSFELVSQKGEISFFVRFPADLREVFSSTVYSFYPDAILTEEPDYVFNVNFNLDEYELWGCEWKLDKDDTIPIATYKELNTNKDSETSPLGDVDPLSPLYESITGLREGEYIWVQFVMRPEVGKWSLKKTRTDLFNDEYWEKSTLSDRLQKKVQKIYDETKEKAAGSREGTEGLEAESKRIAKKGNQLVEQPTYELGIRMLYFTEISKFNKDKILALTNSFANLNTSSNKLKVFSPIFNEIIHYEIDDKKKKGSKKYNKISSDLAILKEEEKIRMFNLYRDRFFWMQPAAYPHFLPDYFIPRKGSLPINFSKYKYPEKTDLELLRPSHFYPIEILATICHFPTKFIKTPTVERSQIKSGEPPKNLPE